MARIEPGCATPRPPGAEGEAAALAEGVAILPPLDRREPDRAAPRWVTRSPPALRLPEPEGEPADPIDAALRAELREIGRADPNELAYAVAELALRREDEVLGSGDEAAAAGLAALSEMTRMLQHLFLMRTGRGGA